MNLQFLVESGLIDSRMLYGLSYTFSPCPLRATMLSEATEMWKILLTRICSEGYLPHYQNRRLMTRRKSTLRYPHLRKHRYRQALINAELVGDVAKVDDANLFHAIDNLVGSS